MSIQMFVATAGFMVSTNVICNLCVPSLKKFHQGLKEEDLKEYQKQGLLTIAQMGIMTVIAANACLWLPTHWDGLNQIQFK